MSRLPADRGRSSAFRATLLILVLASAVAGCSGAERARRDAEIGALRGQVEELKKAQQASAQDRVKLAEEVRVLSAQSAFLVGEAKAGQEELGRVKGALDQSDSAIRGLQSSVEEALRKAAAAAAPPPPPPPPPSPTPAPPPVKPSPPPSTRDVTAERLYASGMASFRADEHGQAVLDFTELTEKFSKHPLAPTAQYWIGEAYYRQRDFRQSLTEFQKVADLYPQGAQVPDALLKLGLCYRALRDAPRARATWEQVVRDHPGTDAALQARSLLSSPGASGRRAR